MNASRSLIDPAYTSRDPFAPGTIVLGQELTEGKSGLMVWLRAYERRPSSTPPKPRLLVERIGLFPSSGEIRRAVHNPFTVLKHLRTRYASEALDMDESSGLSLTFTEWRFKIRLSEAEPEILLHVESRGDVTLMQMKTAELLDQIDENNMSEP